jgi:phosphoenolpyruvate-protein kinase (PTS system EI component)
MAGDPLAIPLLLGLGLDEFSMSPSMIPDIKDRIRHLSIDESRTVAAQCLEADSAQRVRSILAQYA